MRRPTSRGCSPTGDGSAATSPPARSGSAPSSTGETSAAIDSSLAEHRALLADVGHGRLLGLVSLSGEPGRADYPEVLEQLGLARGRVARSAARRDPAALHDALREAGILLELLIDERAMLPAHEETYRLLVGVMIRNPDELTLLRSSTIAELERYDELHDTELLATLEAFLAHHGSTTETAETMQLHRHTVGYRLARVHEVSGLSPYESDGRERLSLGLEGRPDHGRGAERRRKTFSSALGLAAGSGACARSNSSRVGSRPSRRARRTQSVCAWRRREWSPSGNMSMWSLSAGSSSPHSGQ